MASPEAELVLQRMTTLSANETYAIEQFVDGLVALGQWDNVFDCYALALNGDDYQTGWKRDKFTIVQGITHTPGTGITAADANAHMSLGVTPAALRIWDATGTSMGGWCLSAISTGGNGDYGGAVGGTGSEWYFRNRTNAGGDVQ